jgi:hypothetical protein
MSIICPHGKKFESHGSHFLNFSRILQISGSKGVRPDFFPPTNPEIGGGRGAGVLGGEEPRAKNAKFFIETPVGRSGS